MIWAAPLLVESEAAKAGATGVPIVKRTARVATAVAFAAAAEVEAEPKGTIDSLGG